MHEKCKDAVPAIHLIHTVSEVDIVLAVTKLNKPRHFVFEWWSDKHLLVRLDLHKKDNEEKAIDILTTRMPKLLREFKNTRAEKEVCLILVNGNAVVRTSPDREWNLMHPGDGHVLVYTDTLIRYPWDPDFNPHRYKTFPNRFEADYFARRRIGTFYRSVEVLSEKGIKIIIKRLVPLRWETHIEDLFRNCSHQKEVLENLYRRIMGSDWDRAEKIHGWPRVHPKDHYRLSKMFVEFDLEHHPDVLPGGLWTSAGFSSDSSVPEGNVDLSGIEIEYQV